MTGLKAPTNNSPSSTPLPPPAFLSSSFPLPPDFFLRLFLFLLLLFLSLFFFLLLFLLFFFFVLQVVWTDQWSTLLTFEDRRIIDDERVSVERPFTKDWNLHIRDVQHKDQGLYNCQINTSPVKIKTVHLTVQGESHFSGHGKERGGGWREGGGKKGWRTRRSIMRTLQLSDQH